MISVVPAWLRCSLLLPLPLAVPVTGAELDYSVGAQLHYKEASQPIAIQDKRASFRVGGAALQLAAAHRRYGKVYLLAGGGYSPKEQASFLGASVSGSADSYFYGVGYEYRHPLSDRHTVVASADYIDYRVEGDFSGVRGTRPVAATIRSDVSTADLSLGWGYRWSEQASLVAGIGQSDWQIDATARGRLGEALSARTQAVADGRDSFVFIGGEYRGFTWPISWRYQRGALNADNRVTLNALQVTIAAPL